MHGIILIGPQWLQQHEKMHECYRSNYLMKQYVYVIYLNMSLAAQMEKYYDMWIERCEYMKTPRFKSRRLEWSVCSNNKIN